MIERGGWGWLEMGFELSFKFQVIKSCEGFDGTVGVGKKSIKSK